MLVSMTITQLILNSDKVTLKLDWNADEKNKLSLSARYVDAFNIEGASHLVQGTN